MNGRLRLRPKEELSGPTTMAHPSPRADTIDEVRKAAAADGHWHSRVWLVERIPSDPDEITTALHFLTKHGFAQSAGLGGETCRMVRLRKRRRGSCWFFSSRKQSELTRSARLRRLLACKRCSERNLHNHLPGANLSSRAPNHRGTHMANSKGRYRSRIQIAANGSRNLGAHEAVF